MSSRCNLTRALLLIVATVALVCPVHATQTTKQLANGVTLTQDINTTPGSELVVDVVTVDPKAPGVSLKAALGQDVVYVDEPTQGREAIASLTGRRGALIGINGDFFPFTGDPAGLCVIDGELVSEPAFHRVIIGVKRDGTIVFDNPEFQAKLTLANGMGRQIDGINRERKTNELVAFTPIYGSGSARKFPANEVVLACDDLPLRPGKPVHAVVTDVKTNSANTPIPAGCMVLSAGGPAGRFLGENLKKDDRVTIQFDVKSANSTDWMQIDQAITGAPWLVKNGKVFIDNVAESRNKAFVNDMHPRSAVGTTADGKLLIVAVDGRQPGISKGISLPDLAALMKKYGAVNAINLDGGGSTTLSYRGILINSPSGGDQRPVADALLVFAAPTSPDIANLKVTGPTDGVPVRKGAQLSVTCGDNAQPATKEQLDQIVWGTVKGNGFVNQQGYLIPTSLKHVSPVVMSGQQSATLSVSTTAGAPAKLDAKVAPDANDATKFVITVTISDADNNPCAAKPVALVVVGGKTDSPSGVTDSKGQFSAPVTWDAGAGEQTVKVTSGALTATASLPAKQ